MPIDPAYFVLVNALGIEKGDRIRYATAHDPPVLGEGTVKLVWLGIEEVVDVVHDDGSITTLYPYCDWIEAAL